METLIPPAAGLRAPGLKPPRSAQDGSQRTVTVNVLASAEASCLSSWAPAT